MRAADVSAAWHSAYDEGSRVHRGPIPGPETRAPGPAEMGIFLDSLPMSGIVRIRDMMYTVKNPFRLDQGDVSFDAPESFKDGMRKAIDANHTHYLPTLGLPRLRQLIAEKLRTKNGIPVESDDDIIVSLSLIHISEPTRPY